MRPATAADAAAFTCADAVPTFGALDVGRLAETSLCTVVAVTDDTTAAAVAFAAFDDRLPDGAVFDELLGRVQEGLTAGMVVVSRRRHRPPPPPLYFLPPHYFWD